LDKNAHVGTVCLLSKLSEVKNHISVKVDKDEMDVTAAELQSSKERGQPVAGDTEGEGRGDHRGI